MEPGNLHFWSVTLSLGTGLLVGWRFHRLVSARTISGLSKWITWNYKLVLVVPKQTESRLAVSRIAEHSSTASILAYKTSARRTPISCFVWSITGQRKVVLKTRMDHELESIRQQASLQLLSTCLIRDDESSESTVLAVGPAPDSVINQITGHLKLF